MDLLGHIAAARQHLDQIEQLHRHQLAAWAGVMRDSTRPCSPSEQPDSHLGAALRSVRDHLRPAPGRPVDPAFDEVVAAVGLDEARHRAEYLAAAGCPSDEIWLALRDMARNRRADMERME